MNVLLFRGWLGVFSTGLNEIGHKVKSRHPDVTVRVYEWDQWPKALRETSGWKDSFILVGHSYGVAAMFDFARETPNEVRYAIAIDPSQYVWLTREITSNTPPHWLAGYNFYQKPWNPLAIGGVEIPGWTNHKVSGVSHADMDDHPDIQEAIVKMIGERLG